LRQLPRRH